MSGNVEFVDGFRVYAPNERAPDYIIANVQLDSAQLREWLAAHAGTPRLVIKRAKSGKYYAQVDTYQRDSSARPVAPGAPQSASDDVPFIDDSIPF